MQASNWQDIQLRVFQKLTCNISFKHLFLQVLSSLALLLCANPLGQAGIGRIIPCNALGGSFSGTHGRYDLEMSQIFLTAKKAVGQNMAQSSLRTVARKSSQMFPSL